MSSGQQPLSREEVLNELSWRVNSLDSKIRINEQNILNERKQIQLINRNFLELKKELRERIDNLMQDMREIKDKISKVKIPARSVLALGASASGAGMTKEDAKRILDQIVSKGTGA
ncbi:MAG: hypothetical protein ABIG20_02070 [archaeon]